MWNPKHQDHFFIKIKFVGLEEPILELKTYHKKNADKWGLVRDEKTKARK